MWQKVAKFKGAQYFRKALYSPWFTPDLTALDQHKNILWHTALASNSLHDVQLFREVRNQYTQAVSESYLFQTEICIL